MVDKIFKVFEQLQELQKNQTKDNFYKTVTSTNVIGILHVDRRNDCSIIIELNIEGKIMSFEGLIQNKVLYFKKVSIPHAIFRENLLLAILIEILAIVSSNQLEGVMCWMDRQDYYKRLSAPFRLAGFTRSRGTTGDRYTFTGVFTEYLNKLGVLDAN